MTKFQKQAFLSALEMYDYDGWLTVDDVMAALSVVTKQEPIAIGSTLPQFLKDQIQLLSFFVSEEQIVQLENPNADNA